MRTTLREVTSGLGNLADNGTTGTLPQEYQRSLRTLAEKHASMTPIAVGNTRAVEIKADQRGAPVNGLGDLVLVVQ